MGEEKQRGSDVVAIKFVAVAAVTKGNGVADETSGSAVARSGHGHHRALSERRRTATAT